MALALRLVEERNSSRNLAPAATAVGLRLQSEGTTAETAAVAALVSVSALLASSVKLTLTLIVVPRSAATSV